MRGLPFETIDEAMSPNTMLSWLSRSI